MELTPEKKIAGLLAPLFALRGKDDLGVGDVAALREFVDWSAELGFRLVQLLPINETGGDHSPYNAISSAALEPLTIELTPAALPDLAPIDLAELAPPAALEKLRAGPVQYPEVKALKLGLLRRAYETFLDRTWRSHGSRARRFQQFCKTEAAWLEDYALFRVLMEEHGNDERWDRWPEAHRDAARARTWLAAQSPTDRRTLEGRMRFRKYIQWIAYEQWRAAKDHAGARKVALMGDIPFGVSYYSADVWAHPEIFDHQWCGGCPPERLLKVDEFTYKWGQNWGIPLYRWDVLRAGDYAWWRQRVLKVRDVLHLFRIDHILGFFRIYGFPWRPELNAEFLPLTEDEAKARTGGELPHFVPHEDDTDAHKTANRAQGEDALRVLVHECGQFRLIGEDLGAVPDYVRPCLRELEIAGFKIPQWESEHDGSMIAGAKYERLSLATYATHDHPPLRAMWEDWMSAIATTGDDDATRNARNGALHEMRRMSAWCGFEAANDMPFAAVHERLLRALFASNSWLALLMITDLFGTAERFNVPGSVGATNWTERLAAPVSAYRAPEWMRVLLSEAGRA